MIELKAGHIEKLEEILGNVPKQIPIIATRAINRAAESARTEGSKVVRKTYNIKHGNVLKKIKIKRARPGDLLADVRTSGRPLSVRNFAVEANEPFPTRGKYARVSVKKGSGGIIRKSFIATTRKDQTNEYKNVFIRVGKGRFPLRSLHGPSVPQMFGRESGIRAMEKRAEEILDKRLEHEIKRLLGG